MLKTCPDPVDVNDIQFKLHCSLKIFENRDVETFQNNHSLISCASRYSLLFVGSNGAYFKVIHLKTVENFSHKDKEITNYPRRNISLPSPPKHVCVNCDSTILAVVVQRDNCPIGIFYDVLSFYKNDISIIREVRLSATPGIYVTEVNWNPSLPGMFTACKSDGSLGNYDFKDNTVEINELPAASQSTSFCWSPKGKQLAVGSKNGHITQFKPDLKAVKVINAPTFEIAHSLISLCWISNYQFIGVYQSSEKDGQAKLIVINAPKTGETNYINYEDVCYSGSVRMPQFYMILLQHWNLLMISSSNSMELGLLGAVSEIWTQWNVSDCARAELPLGPDKQETLPLGMALDISNTKPLPWGEGTLPPSPYLLLLSHQGIIYFYNIINLKEGIPTICCPPDPIIDVSGMGYFVISDGTEIKGTTPETKSTFSFLPSQQPAIKTNQPTTISLPQTISQPPKSTFMFTSQPAPILNIPQPSTPSNTSAFSKPVDNIPLFGSQVTLTPVKAQPQSTLTFGCTVSVTPVNTQPKGTQSNDKYSSIFAALKTPTPVADAKPILVSTKTEPQSPQTPKIVTPEIQTPETPKSEASKVVDPKLVIDEKVKGETQALFAKMVKDECICLESELKAVLHQGRSIDINIGTNEEKIMILKEIQDFQDFIKEIVDVSLGESAEIHSLKQNLILSWAWYEEALSRFTASKDETKGRILKSQPLDSATEKRRSDIQKIIYYLDSQLSQASRALDEQWDKFQDYTKKTHQVQMPTMEAIFQAMVRQNAILKKQSYILKDISGRLKQRKVSGSSPPLFVGLNINRIEEDLKRLQIDPESNHRIIYEQTRERQKKLSSSKMNKLKDFLKNREISHVTAIKPSFNYSRIKTPVDKNKHMISILGAQMSPVAKPAVVKNLQFSESTPLKPSQDIRPTTVPPNTPAQQDLSKSFTFKSLDKNIAPPSTGTFQPLSKSASTLSNLNQIPISSAFVPTTQASKNFVLSSVSPAVSIFSPAVTGSPTWLPGIQLTQFSLGNTLGTTQTSTKPVFSFDTKSTPDNSVKTEGISTSFSFGKSSGAVTTNVVLKPIVTLSKVPETSVSILPTSQSLFSFGKSTTDTPKTTMSSQTTATVTVTKPILVASSKATNFTFGTPHSTSASSIVKPVGIATTSTTTAVKSTSLPNFGALTITSTAVTTQTTSLFGSISSSSVASSLFTPKSTVAPASTTSLIEPKASVTVDTTSPATVEPSTISINTIKNIPDSSSENSTSTMKTIFTPTTTSLSITPVTVTPSTGSFMFGSSTGSIFSSASTAPTSKSIFGAPISSTTTSIFSPPKSSASSANIPSTKTSVLTINSSSNIISTVSSPTTSADSTNIITSTTPTTVNTSDVSSEVITSTTKQDLAVTTQALPFDNKVVTTQISISTTTTQGTIFGNVSTTSQAPIFSSTVTTSQSSVFSSPAVTTSASILGTPTMQTSIFGGATTTSDPTKGFIFSNSSPTTVSAIFGTPVTSTSVFGKSTAPSNFSTPVSSQSSIFGTPTTSQSSIFGQPTSTQATGFGSPASSASIFGGSAPSTQATVFGNSSTTSQSIFGAPPASSGSIFSSTHNSAFGAATTQSSIFGSPAPVVTSASIFGAPSTTSVFGQSSNSIFGSTTFGSTPTTTAFGQPATFGSTSTTTAFGQPATFGSTPTTTAFGQPATFGSTPTTTTAFGQPATFGSNSGSIFNTTTTSNSIFGSGGTAFGAPSTSSNSFGSASSNAFSFAQAANSNLGFGGLNVGGTPSTTNSIFGGSSTFGQAQQNPFSRPSTFQTPTTATASIFGSSTGSIFGSNTQGTFGSSSFGTSGGFGQQPTFGQSAFGQQSTFGSPQAGNFSSGGSGVVQTGFGSPGSFQKPGGFGAPPVFGGSAQPAFGASPTFGGASTFGGAPTFGSPPKVFGSNTPAASFGSTDNTNTGFGNLANQNTVGFGSLAQQTATPTSLPFSGNSSFSTWR
ncbi:nuclear pore complex protein DDB_G0274915 isoform X1 [Diorhabda sublineata]|uniref:nuclear pore complex protein DDB_G0274915 isoform X1 n=1 Tax=Diorhabda sublineata TaxID=1163346 RepID=UPI0024E080CA|nr:nuclear pore complex protein DDB_G0274915 isoform X1 [Diorhabda sublineata]